MTTYGSLFSGVGGFDLGCDAAGWDCVWQVEWDAKARSVLERHWPTVPKHEDVRDVNGHELTPVDVITYGFPCQDLSVAGKRAGLDGDRSGLFFEAIRIIREMREATDGAYPRVAVAENVLGLLNADKGAAMGRCLDALAEIGALAIEWRVLDAQFFGVPQRRRRVFLVACFDPRAASRGQVLPEPESVPGNPPQGRKAREEVASTLGGGSGSRGWSSDVDRMTFVPATPNGVRAVAMLNFQGSKGNNVVNDGQQSFTLNAMHGHDAHVVFVEPDAPATHTGSGGDVESGRASGRGERAGRVHGASHPELAGTVSAKWAKGTGGPAGDECQNLVLDVTP